MFQTQLRTRRHPLPIYQEQGKLQEIRLRSLFKPATTQEEFYSEFATRLMIAKHLSKNLWRLTDQNPVESVHVAINQAIACFRDTTTTLNYDTSNLHLRDKLMEPHAGTN